MHFRRYPVDLSARMAVCDANYIRILKLFPDFAAAAIRTFTLPCVNPENAQRVVIEVVETFRYTSTVSIRLSVPQLLSGFYRPPAMLIRLYHDASTAEVVSYQDQREIHEPAWSDTVPRFYPDEKEQLNLFLAEWLSLCLEAGMGQPSGAGHEPGLIPSA